MHPRSSLLLGLVLGLTLPACGLLNVGKADEDDGGDGGGSSTDDNDGDGYSIADGDCDDDDPFINPEGKEYCDGVDNDCDGAIDEDDASDAPTWYPDADGDGHGTEEDAITACERPEGYVVKSDDCDDADADNFPDNDESCDGQDNDCDDEVDEGVTGTLYRDEDGDGFGDAFVTQDGCSEGDGWVFDDSDCDDGDDERFPGNTEVCDDKDNDCDSEIDEDAVDGVLGYPDNDGDGMGAPGEEAVLCDAVENNWDCDDRDAGEPQVVDADSIWTEADGSLDFPHMNIQDGIDAASDCVVVMEGVYREAIDFGGRRITVTGVSGPSSTIIDGRGLGSAVVTFDSSETASSVLDGFTIRAGDGYVESDSVSTTCNSTETCTDYYDMYCGGGVFVDGADPILRNLVFTDNELPDASVVEDGNDTYTTTSFGGAGCFLNSSATLHHVMFEANAADQGGALYVDDYSAIDIDQGAFYMNRATDGGAIQVDGGSVTLINVLTAGNEADDDGGGVLIVDGSLSATNVTLAYETASTGAGIYASGSSSATVLNSIVANASSQGVLIDSGASYLGSYSNVYGSGSLNYAGTTDPTGVSGNISSNPLFTDISLDGDYTNDDYTLRSTSPSVDAGNPSSAYDDADGTRNDMGAYGGPDGDW
ncbi:MAG: hypothetical protein H6742_01750 [Alphaproteobacteria bacterium]|nr:hypothetical protein [Alphaproteobacteria bacterium]